MLLFWSPWFKYRYIKIDLITVGKFCFNFRRVLGGVVDPARARLNHGLRDARNVCAITKVGTVLKTNRNIKQKPRHMQPIPGAG